MKLIFFQNCISPHQIPYIRECVNNQRIENVYLIVPRTDYSMRRNMGWDSSGLLRETGINYLLKPLDEQVKALLKKENVVCLFSGIRADVDVFHWLNLSFNYNVKRYIITEPPYTYNKPLWMHYIRFFIQDYRYIKHITGVFAIGQMAFDYYRSISKKWKVYPFQYVTENIKRTSAIALQGKLKLLFVGSLSSRKNVKVVLKSLIGLSDIEFSIVGNGEEEKELKQFVQSNNLSVTFLGVQPMDKIPSIMEKHDILILPSLHDGWGAVINEAMTLGLFVIASDKCGAKALIKQDIQGRVFKSNDAFSLHNILNECIINKEIIRQQQNKRLQLCQIIQAPFVADYFIQCLTESL